MKKITYIALVAMTSSTVAAEEARQLDAHEHGVGQLDIAFDGAKIAMEFHAPGADIVGFEYAAESAEDRAKVDTAVATLARPLALFELPAAAGCSVVQASAELESEEAHEDHDEHAHDDHKEEAHGDEDHAAHEDHEHDHDEHAEHAHEASHTEFHAEYLLNCADTSAADLITFAYFDSFPNALELEVQVITEKGATAFEVTREAPTLDLRDMF
ncbi:DUF2796 domain-containing protein [uncultured Roseobacter sp.]|uniref:zinc uptake protein ZrgA n=1 Tax=uncultured Roseobacter sp. TaxID=114847 RepID=UPI002634C701|nr:DUF2796 domain-containing protein [uncultured Roseobacter sp.]